MAKLPIATRLISFQIRKSIEKASKIMDQFKVSTSLPSKDCNCTELMHSLARGSILIGKPLREGRKLTDSETIVSEKKEAARIADVVRLEDGLGFMLRLLNTRMNGLYQEFTDQDPTTPGQFGCLLKLHQKGRLTLTALAAEICVDRATMTAMARRLEDRGLVVRRPNLTDGRSAELSLTKQGYQTMLALMPGAVRLQAVLLAPIPAAERRHFLRLMKLVAWADVRPLVK